MFDASSTANARVSRCAAVRTIDSALRFPSSPYAGELLARDKIATYSNIGTRDFDKYWLIGGKPPPELEAVEGVGRDGGSWLTRRA
jgi:hypothetical protein